MRFERASAEKSQYLTPLSTPPLPPRPRRLLRHDLRIDLLLHKNSESSASRFRHTRGDGSPSHRRLTGGSLQLVVEIKILAASATSSGNGIVSVAIHYRRGARITIDTPLFAFISSSKAKSLAAAETSSSRRNGSWRARAISSSLASLSPSAVTLAMVTDCCCCVDCCVDLGFSVRGEPRQFCQDEKTRQKEKAHVPPCMHLNEYVK